MEVEQKFHMKTGEGDDSYAKNSTIQDKEKIIRGNAMEVEQVFHMNIGEGHDSYAKNSTIQRKVILAAYSFIEEAIKELLSDESISKESIGIADLGCSSGPNTLLVITKIIDTITAMCCLSRCAPELRISLNDLYGNDFNNIFQSLPEFYKKLNDENGDVLENKCFVSAVPGSFYGRLFGRGSLHFMHSSFSLHWLSQVPTALQSNGSRMLINKGKIALSVTSPIGIVDAYLLQFKNDFALFLKVRSEEMVKGGRMVLSFKGRKPGVPPTDVHNCFEWEVFAQTLMSMASEGLIGKEKIDSFNLPYYAPSPEELMEVAKTESSFNITRIEAFETYWNELFQEQMSEFETSPMSHGQRVAKNLRVVVEPIMEFHFGKEIMDELFLRLGKNVDDQFSKQKLKFTYLIVSLTKKG